VDLNPFRTRHRNTISAIFALSTFHLRFVTPDAAQYVNPIDLIRKYFEDLDTLKYRTHWADSTNVILTGRSDVGFLTCDGVSRLLNFKLYAAPFDLMTWLGLGITALVIIPMVVVTFHARSLSEYNWRTNLALYLNVLLYNFGSFLEVIGKLPCVMKNTTKLGKVRIVLGLTSLVKA